MCVWPSSWKNTKPLLGGKKSTSVYRLKCFSDQNPSMGTSLAIQRLRHCASDAEGKGSIPGQGTMIPHAARPQPEKNPETSIAPHRRCNDVHTLQTSIQGPSHLQPQVLFHLLQAAWTPRSLGD